ncbi:TPA: PorV/PorQ family protein [Candidatus Poribacteria bacterium]|nr:PorV/PorQ family protein [Candidatus Poribacteria bacterium]
MNNKTLKISIILIVVSLFSFYNHFTAYGSEKYAGEFLSIGTGARALGMGGSFVAVADDGTSAYWNPAGLGGLKQTELIFMHTSMFGFDNYDFVNITQPIGKSGTTALSWIRLGIGDIPMTQLSTSNPISASNRPKIVGYMQDTENAFMLSYGKRLKSDFLGNTGFQLGGTVKFLYNSVSGAKRNAIGLGGDVGFIWRSSLLSDNQDQRSADLSIGIIAQDFFKTRLIWNTTSSPSHTDIIQPNLKFGIAYFRDIPSISSKALLSIDANTRYGLGMHYGIEYILYDLLALRAGLQGKDFTAGAGLNVSFAKGESEMSFLVDYAFLSHELGNSHRISLMTKF